MQQGLGCECETEVKRRKNYAAGSGIAVPGWGSGKIAICLPLWCGCRLLCAAGVRYAFCPAKLHGGAAGRGLCVCPCPRQKGVSYHEHAAHQCRGRPLGGSRKKCSRCRRGCLYRGRPGCAGGGEKACPRRGYPFLHPNGHHQLRQRHGGVSSGGQARGAGPGNEPGGYCHSARQNTAGAGNRGLCTRCHVHEHFGPLPDLQLSGRARRQPRPVRPALPLEVLSDGGDPPRAVFPRWRKRKRQLYSECRRSLHSAVY